MREMFSAAEVAARLGVNAQTVRKHLQGRKIGRRVLYPEAEIRKLTGEVSSVSLGARKTNGAAHVR